MFGKKWATFWGSHGAHKGAKIDKTRLATHELTMKWKDLVYGKGKDSDGRQQKAGGRVRTEMEESWDKIVFSFLFRRLQRKTQVIPFPQGDFLHTRLTHSIETTSVGRSLGRMVGKHVAENDLSDYPDAEERITGIVSVACLVHDIGHPPFAHSGEYAIRHFFAQREEFFMNRLHMNEEQYADFKHFDGNANGFHELTKSEAPKLSDAILAAYVKYPQRTSGQKSSVFFCDKVKYGALRGRLGMPANESRHPLTYLIEAADDICYRIVDFEDAIEVGAIEEKEGLHVLSNLLEATYEAAKTAHEKAKARPQWGLDSLKGG